MEKNIEQLFVERYIDKGYQERLLFELGSSRKRANALSRFSHHAENILNKSLHKRMISGFHEVHESDKTVYVISWDENDGTNVSLEDAIQYCEDTYSSVILIGCEFSLIKEETEDGNSKLIYLKKY